MTEAVMNRWPISLSSPNNALKAAATCWFLVAALGHWIFTAYVLGFYGPLLVGRGLEALGDTHLPNGFVPGEPLGNAAVAVHLLLAVVLMGGGPLQLIPRIRAVLPRFHRWLGRTYLLAAVASAAAGLYMVWSRGTLGGVLNEIALSLDAVLIIVFAAITVRSAIARDIGNHRRWALRLFMVVGGVWFFRIGLSGWVFVTGGAGIDFETFTGPFIYFLGFGQYLLPLAVLELYFHTSDRGGASGRIAMAAGLFMLTVVMGVGIFAASAGMWLPRI